MQQLSVHLMKLATFLSAAVAAVALSGCASVTSLGFLKKSDPVPPPTMAANPAEQAYNMGRDQGLGIACAREVPFTVLNEHKESVRMLLSTFTIEWQRSAQWEFQRGVADIGKLKRDTIDCSTVKEHLIAQIACNYDEAGQNLKRDTHFK